MAIFKPGSFNVSFFDEAAARKNFISYPLRVVAYARLSFDEDGANFCSIINQRDILTKFYHDRIADSKSTLEFIADDNVSGYKFEREGLFRLVNMIETGLCNVIIAKDLSRIGRHGALIQLFIEQCERVGVRIVAMEDYDSHKQSDEIILGIKAWSNERIVKDTSHKIRKIIDHKQKDGTWLCAVPFGYLCRKYQTGVIEIDESAADTIRLIDRLYLDEDLGCKAIARQLSLDHVPTPSMRQSELNAELGRRTGNKISTTWSCGQIYKILSDDFYVGTLRTGKYTRSGINGRDKRVYDSAHNVFENHHEAIRSLETHQRIQQKMVDRASTNFRATSQAPNKYRGIIYCGDCGSAMFVMNSSNARQHYVCGKYFRLGKEFCSRHSIKTETIDSIAIAMMEMIKNNCGDMMSAIDKELASFKAGARSISHVLNDMRKTRESIVAEQSVIESQRIKRLAAFPDDEERINAIYDQLFEEKQKSLSDINTKISELESADIDHSKTGKELKRAIEIIDSIIQTKEITRADVEVLFKRITVYDDGRVDVDLLPNLCPPDPTPIEVDDKAPKHSTRKYSVSCVNEVQSGDPLETSFISYSRAASEAISFIKQLQTRHML